MTSKLITYSCEILMEFVKTHIGTNGATVQAGCSVYEHHNSINRVFIIFYFSSVCFQLWSTQLMFMKCQDMWKHSFGAKHRKGVTTKVKLCSQTWWLWWSRLVWEMGQDALKVCCFLASSLRLRVDKGFHTLPYNINFPVSADIY